MTRLRTLLLLTTFALPALLQAQPYYQFIGKGANPAAFDKDPANWAAPDAKIIAGVPAPLPDSPNLYRYSLDVASGAALIFDTPGTTTFTESLVIIGGSLTVKQGSLVFQDLRKDAWQNRGSLLQGQGTITVEKDASLTLGSLFMDKFNHTYPTPWLVINSGKVVFTKNLFYLCGVIHLNGTASLQTPVINFGHHYNSSLITFQRGSKATLTADKLIFEDKSVSFEHMVYMRYILIDGRAAKWRDFKQEGNTLSLR